MRSAAQAAARASRRLHQTVTSYGALSEAASLQSRTALPAALQLRQDDIDRCSSSPASTSFASRMYASRSRPPPGPQAAAIARAVRERRLGLVNSSPAVEETALEVANAFEYGVSQIFSGAALIVTRTVEWGQLILGFEQAQKYTIFDETGRVVAYMAEETASIGTALTRQLLRNHRPFTITVLDVTGVVLFRVRRPAYFINSSVFIEDGNENVVGEVHQRWHLWKRNYDLYIEKRQFASVRGGLLAWEFELQDNTGRPMAKIDRNFSGFGVELFTDAGTYVVHFAKALKGGLTPEAVAQQEAATAAAATAATTGVAPAAGGAAVAAAGAVTPQSALWTHSGAAGAPVTVPGHGADTWHPPALSRPLRLTERAIALATAISVDYDYFSRHSGGFGFGGFGMPIIIPGGSTTEEGQAPSSDGTAQAQAHDEMMESQKGGGVGGVMGAVGMDSMGRGGAAGDGAAAGSAQEGAGRSAGVNGDAGGDEKEDDFWSGWGNDDKDDGDDDGGDDDDDGGGGGGVFGFVSSVLSGDSSD